MSAGFGSDTQITRRITDLEIQFRGGIPGIPGPTGPTGPAGPTGATGPAGVSGVINGTVSLAVSPATSTVVSHASVTTSYRIFLQANSAAAFSLDNGVTGITAGTGSFTIAHSASALTRSFHWLGVV